MTDADNNISPLSNNKPINCNTSSNYKRPAPEDDGDVSSIDENGTDPGNTGEILHCLFPGCLKEFSSRWSLTRHTRSVTIYNCSYMYLCPRILI